MNAIAKRPLKSGKVQSVYGKVLQNGNYNVILVVVDKSGNQSIKSFKRNVWDITIY